MLQLYYQVLNFGMIVSSALMIWKGLMVVTGSESPIVVVLRYVRKSTLSAFPDDLEKTFVKGITVSSGVARLPDTLAAGYLLASQSAC